MQNPVACGGLKPISVRNLLLLIVHSSLSNLSKKSTYRFCNKLWLLKGDKVSTTWQLHPMSNIWIEAFDKLTRRAFMINRGRIPTAFRRARNAALLFYIDVCPLCCLLIYDRIFACNERLLYN
jgi:hypothetical protein